MSDRLSREELVNKLADHIIDLSNNKDLFIVGISGLDASGKSKFADSLSNVLNLKNKNTLVFSGDSFQFPKEYKNDLQEKNWALQHIKRTINFQRMINEVLEPLRLRYSHLDLKILNYDTGGLSTQRFKVKYPVIVLIESIYLFQKPLTNYLDYMIFLEIDMDTALSRACKRPRDLHLYGSVDGIREKYVTKNFAGYELFNKLSDPKKLANVIIDNNNWKYPVLKKYQ